MIDSIDRVWTDEHGATHVVTRDAEAGIVLRATDFDEAGLETASTPGGEETTVWLQLGATYIGFSFR